MVRPVDLMGLGQAYPLANALGENIAILAVQGVAFGSAIPVPGFSGIYYANATNSGNYAILPTVGGSGCNLGDNFMIVNNTAGSIVVCASAGTQIIYQNAQTSGSVGVSVTSFCATEFLCITSSTWIGLKG